MVVIITTNVTLTNCAIFISIFLSIKSYNRLIAY